MKSFYISLLICLSFLVSLAYASGSYLYTEVKKDLNGGFEYRLPKVEWNYYKSVGKFFGMDCLYLSEIDTSLVFTAPRENIGGLNHHSVEANCHWGVQISPFWATFSVGGRQYLEGNDSKIPAEFYMTNILRIGMEF